MKRRIISIFLTVCIILTAVPINVQAQEAENLPIIKNIEAASGSAITYSASTVSGNQSEIDAIVISTPDELIDFATKINDKTYPANKNAILTADLDMAGKTWTPIGGNFNHYRGTFDGKGHTIQNLYLDKSSDNYIGVFGYIEGATIRNLGVTGAFSGYIDVGGIVGRLDGGSTIENCWNGAEINGEMGNYGGIAGWLEAPGSIVNCYNYGTVTGLYDTGGIAGTIYGNNATVENCFNYGKIKKKTDDSTVHGIGQSYADALVKNCYYLADSELSDDNAAPKTAEEFQSGEVTWLLNGESSDGVWKQTIDNDYYPNFKGNKVYKYADGSYSNEEGHTITLVVSQGGSVSGEGVFGTGTSVTVIATPDADYHFVKWTENGSDISNDASYTFEAIGNRTLTAVFEEHQFDNDCDTDCNNAGCTYTRTITHQPNNDDGDCTTPITCKICGVTTTAAKDAHNFTAETVSADYLKSKATCTTQAEYYKSCSVCGTSSKGIDDTATFTSGGFAPHNMTFNAEKPPTTTADGMKAHYICSICKVYFDKDKAATTADALKIPKKDSGGSGDSGSGSDHSGSENNNSGYQPQETEKPKEPEKTPDTIETEKPSKPQKPTQPPKPGTEQDNGKPFIKDNADKEGWDIITDQTENADDGDTVIVDMNGTTTISGNVIESIAGKNITVVFDMGNGINWSVNGLSVRANDIKDINLSVSRNTKNIPVDIINHLTGERYSMTISLKYDGEFGFTAVLTINVDKKNAGLFANLFYYNEADNELEFICADEIDAKGNTRLEFTHASDYTIVIDKAPMDGSVEKTTESTEQTEETTQYTEPEVLNTDEAPDSNGILIWVLIVVAVAVLVGVGSYLYYVQKKEDDL